MRPRLKAVVCRAMALGRDFASRQFDQHGLAGGDLDRRGCPEEEGQQGDVPDLDAPAKGQRSETEGLQGHECPAG